mmetsp:Transcript_10937/g.31800  ORF Transcript_10937/g.31800 Transcript_10937/m.31800 type:complete len:327 (+) Transcript_10937:95-1075(+)
MGQSRGRKWGQAAEESNLLQERSEREGVEGTGGTKLFCATLIHSIHSRDPPQVMERELAELAPILKDDEKLLELAAWTNASPQAMLVHLLGDEALSVVERLHDVSHRLIIRQQARAAAHKFGCSIENLRGKHQGAERNLALDAVLGSIWPAYMRFTPAENADRDTATWLSKLYLHGVGPKRSSGDHAPEAPGEGPISPAPSTLPGGLTLYARFSLVYEFDRGLADLSLDVRQVAPRNAHGLSFTWTIEDVCLNDQESASWTVLDNSLRDKLAELQSVLGLTSTMWGPTAMLGLLLAACTGLPSCEPAQAMLAQLRAAHREEVLAGA